MYLIDTNVISESRKRSKADGGVRAFFKQVAKDDARVFISVVTVGELRRQCATRGRPASSPCGHFAARARTECALQLAFLVGDAHPIRRRTIPQEDLHAGDGLVLLVDGSYRRLMTAVCVTWRQGLTEERSSSQGFPICVLPITHASWRSVTAWTWVATQRLPLASVIPADEHHEQHQDQ